MSLEPINIPRLVSQKLTFAECPTEALSNERCLGNYRMPATKRGGGKLGANLDWLFPARLAR